MDQNKWLRELQEQWQLAITRAVEDISGQAFVDGEVSKVAAGLHLKTGVQAGTYYWFGQNFSPIIPGGTHQATANACLTHYYYYYGY